MEFLPALHDAGRNEGKKGTLGAAASAALRASFQALRVVGFFDSAMSISSGSV
jgi:hypothetical protein